MVHDFTSVFTRCRGYLLRLVVERPAALPNFTEEPLLVEIDYSYWCN